MKNFFKNIRKMANLNNNFKKDICFKKEEYVEDEYEDSLDILMEDLSFWRKRFLDRKMILNNRLSELDYKENQLKNRLCEINSQEELISLNKQLSLIINEKKTIINEKKIIRKIDFNEELSYDMIGKKINNYNYYLKKSIL